MKTIWGIVGVLVILILISFIVNRTRRNNGKPAVVLPIPTSTPAPVEKEVVKEVIVQQPTPYIFTPIIIRNWSDCNSTAYQSNLQALYNDYAAKRAAYEAELAASGPNVIALRSDMNIAYNAWYSQKRKCVFIS